MYAVPSGLLSVVACKCKTANNGCFIGVDVQKLLKMLDWLTYHSPRYRHSTVQQVSGIQLCSETLGKHRHRTDVGHCTLDVPRDSVQHRNKKKSREIQRKIVASPNIFFMLWWVPWCICIAFRVLPRMCIIIRMWTALGNSLRPLRTVNNSPELWEILIFSKYSVLDFVNNLKKTER